MLYFSTVCFRYVCTLIHQVYAFSACMWFVGGTSCLYLSYLHRCIIVGTSSYSWVVFYVQRDYERKTIDSNHLWRLGTLLIYLENISCSMNAISSRCILTICNKYYNRLPSNTQYENIVCICLHTRILHNGSTLYMPSNKQKYLWDTA
jgi:hypothetical protein